MLRRLLRSRKSSPADPEKDAARAAEMKRLLEEKDHDRAGALYRQLDEGQKSRLCRSLVGPLLLAGRENQMRQLCHIYRAEPEFGRRVADPLGIDLEAFMAQQTGARSGHS
ncbi:MAG: catalase-related domain-containing protein [Acidobacteriota bacterium]